MIIAYVAFACLPVCVSFSHQFTTPQVIIFYLGEKVDNIICEFPVLMPASEFYARNYHLIQFHVNQRTMSGESSPISSL